MSLQDSIRPHLRRLRPYQPIVPLEVLAQEAGKTVEQLIKLDGNENPYGCSPRVRQALASYPFYHIYPDPEQRELRQSLEQYVGLGMEHILVGSGSDELIDLVLRLFLEPGEKVINLVPTFGMYPFSTHVCGGQVVEVERDPQFGLDVAAVKPVIDGRTRVIFIASPNNPSGNFTPAEQIEGLLKTGLVVVVDEAYFEFCGVTVAPLVARYDNLVVLRTFSKWAGLAGLRIGYGLFPRWMMDYLLRIKQPYNINAAAQVAALESLQDLSYLKETVYAIIAERERLFHRLEALSFLKPYPSRANFILCSFTQGKAKEVYYKLREQGIFLRYFDVLRLRQCLRISIGKPEHSEVLIAALREMF